MKIGYARVSTDDQDLGSQIEKLRLDGCEVIYQEKISTRRADRPELARMLEVLKPGDTVVVCKLDRLGRSVIHLLGLIEGFKVQGVGFRSIGEAMDTSTAQGMMIFGMFGVIAEFERALISERTKSTLKYLKAKGVVLGRPVIDRSGEGKELAAMVAEGLTVAEICQAKGWSRGHYFRVRKGSGEGVRRKTMQ